MENTGNTETNQTEELIECPYHKGEFYLPWEYCEQCYIETKLNDLE